MLEIGETIFGTDKRGKCHIGYISEIINTDLIKIISNDKEIEVHNVRLIDGDEIVEIDTVKKFTDEELIIELRNRGYKITKKLK